MKRAIIVVSVGIIALVAAWRLFFEYNIRNWVNFEGQLNSLICDLRTADGSRIDEIELHFTAGDQFWLIPISGMGGGRPDRTIIKSYTLKGVAPGEVKLEWPRLYLRLHEVRCGGGIIPLDWKKGSLVAQWQNHQLHYFPDGSRDWKTYIPGNYRAVVIINRQMNQVTVQKIDDSTHVEKTQSISPAIGINPVSLETNSSTSATRLGR